MYFGGLGSLNYLAFKKGVTTRMVWIWFCAPVLLDIVMEEIMMPIMDCVGYMLVGLPSIFVLNSENVSPLVTNLAGVATFALTALCVHGVALVVATDSPLRKGSANTSPLGELFKKTAAA